MKKGIIIISILMASLSSMAQTFSTELLKAAKKGKADAQKELGLCYLKGLGIQQDIDEAQKWFIESAKQGNAWAQYYLGNIYEDKGEGGMAISCYSQAAEQGIVEAQYKTGMLYKKLSPKVAIEWFTKAAEQDYVEAQFELGRCYFDLFVMSKKKEDLEECKKWLGKAAEQKHEKASTMLSKIQQAEKDGKI